MRLLLPILLLGLLLVGGTGMYALYMYVNSDVQKAARADQKAIEDSGFGSGGGGGGILGFALKNQFDMLTGNVVIEAEGDLAPLVPPAPEGWTVRPYTLADGTAITGKEVVRTRSSKTTTNSILMDFGEDMAAREAAIAVTYETEGRMMALRMRLKDRLNEKTFQGSLMAAVSLSVANTEFSDRDRSGLPQGLFGRLDGVDFILKPQFSKFSSGGLDEPVLYRRFVAVVENSAEIELITTGSDIDAAAVLSRIDMKALQDLLPQPARAFREGVGWVQPEGVTLTDDVPGITLAYRAYQIVSDGQIYGAAETEVLRDIAAGRVASWDDIDPRRNAVAPTERLTGLLGPEPQGRLVRRLAQAIAENPETDGTTQLLSERIAAGRITTRADIYASGHLRGLIITPDFREVIGLLPVGQVDTAAINTGNRRAEAAVEVKETGPVIRRGVTVVEGETIYSNCSIDLGVRRCIINGEEQVVDD